MSTMNKVVPTRFTEEQHSFLQEEADLAGCKSVSEFVRRKALEQPSEGLRETLLLIKELVVSIAAHSNLTLDVMGVDADHRMPIIQQHKVDILSVCASMRSHQED